MAELRRPLGVFLQGGGALGAWQAGALEVLDAAGVRFDTVMGFSIGAVNGSALAFGRLEEALGRWRALDGKVLRLRPRLRPASLFSARPLRELFEEARDEAAAKGALRLELTVLTSCPAQGRHVNARFTPGGKKGWDGPFVEHAVASCAIPLVFPPVDVERDGRRLRLVDGGVPMPRPPDFAPLAGCADVLVLEMVRPEELKRPAWTPWRALDQGGRASARWIVEQCLVALQQGDPPPRVYRLAPSRVLAPMMLDFRGRGVRAMLEQGAEDARAFLAAPEKARAR